MFNDMILLQRIITQMCHTQAFSSLLRELQRRLTLNFSKAIVVEKELCSIGVIEDHDDSKDTKDAGKKNQDSSNKYKEKDSFNIENLSKYLKSLTNEVSKLKRK